MKTKEEKVQLLFKVSPQLKQEVKKQAQLRYRGNATYYLEELIKKDLAEHK